MANPLMLIGSVTITIALILYTAGVWGERIQGRLNKLHLVLFWSGLVFDTTGTTAMTTYAGTISLLDLHFLTGVIAIVLMLIHAVWATVVLYRDNEKELVSFHKYSLVVWIIWLIPFTNGIIMGMG